MIVYQAVSKGVPYLRHPPLFANEHDCEIEADRLNTEIGYNDVKWVVEAIPVRESVIIKAES